MVVFDNLASHFEKVVNKHNNETQKEWRLLGQEKNGSLLVSWTTEKERMQDNVLNIGLFLPQSEEIKVLHKFNKVENVVQASVNSSHSLLSFVIKDKDESNQENVLDIYSTYLVKTFDNGKYYETQSLKTQRSKQIMLTFLNKSFSEKQISTLMILIHHESISLFHLEEKELFCDIIKIDNVTRSFTWAQWDCRLQVLYFIHFKKTLLPSESEDLPLQELSPTLSGLQFHQELPHETVLNIPLNLPSLPKSSENNCCLYEDDPIPLRIHDCSLDLLVVSNNNGVVCICHHYLYQPVKPPQQDTNSPNKEHNNTVHFAYSVTLLHHGCVIHCVVPGIPWIQAKNMRPTFAFLEDEHLVVYSPGLFTHLLDVGLRHEPFCHMLLGGTLTEVPNTSTRLVPLFGDYGCDSQTVMIDMPTMDLICFDVTPDDLIKCFVNVKSMSNRLAILHYFLVHSTDFDCVEELIEIVFEKPTDLNIPMYLQEVLIGGAYVAAKKNLPSDAVGLLNMLPISASYPSGHSEVKVDQLTSTITQEILWNTAMMLLSPQQRLVPYRSDIWTKLWHQLADLSEAPRFKPSQVGDKLLVSLACYQPEALSRCSTPMSPGTSFASAATSIADLGAINAGGITNSRKLSGIELPFFEVENCTASKQEHVISVNLRELSMHLLRNCQRQTPPHVHAVATRYVAAQVELSKQLCSILCRVAGVDQELRNDRGFSLIEQLDDKNRTKLFTCYQRYYYAVESLAYPLPQGFTSFFTYLGFKTLHFDMFLQYLKYNVFELQIDVVKEMMNEIEDTKEGVEKKLRLLHVLPRSRAKRLLNTWQHPVSLMLRAREHSLNILSGVPSTRHRRLSQARRLVTTSKTTTQNRGLAAFPSGDRLSPFDTFLDLLTAKASLTDLDFNLLIEATISSTEEFL